MQKPLKNLDSGFRRNDRKGLFLTSYERINVSWHNDYRKALSLVRFRFSPFVTGFQIALLDPTPAQDRCCTPIIYPNSFSAS
ncbi:MAG: hypothetical protein ACM335_05600 [Deltaproteobacteria bacterium]